MVKRMCAIPVRKELLSNSPFSGVQEECWHQVALETNFSELLVYFSSLVRNGFFRPRPLELPFVARFADKVHEIVFDVLEVIVDLLAAFIRELRADLCRVRLTEKFMPVDVCVFAE